jgi:hypothetical protein
MGLDQYITIRHKSTNRSYKKYNDFWKLSVEEREEKKIPDEPDKDFIVGYFRKHNMIHKWFVDNVQNGVDDCGRYVITVKDLNKLLDICNRIMAGVTKSKKPAKFMTDRDGVEHEIWQMDTYTPTEGILEYAKTILPTQSGFFFGDTDYSDDYFYCVENTIKVIETVLYLCEHNFFGLYTDKETGEYRGRWVLEYHSSW